MGIGGGSCDYLAANSVWEIKQPDRHISTHRRQPYLHISPPIPQYSVTQNSAIECLPKLPEVTIPLCGSSRKGPVSNVNFCGVPAAVPLPVAPTSAVNCTHSEIV